MARRRWFSGVHSRWLLTLALVTASTTIGADDRLTLAKGTAIDIIMADSLSSRWATVGDGFEVRLARALYLDGRLVLPAGTVIEGRVESVESLRRGAKSGYVGIRFVSIVLPSERMPKQLAAVLSGMPQSDPADPAPLEPERRFPVVLIASSPASGHEGAVVLDEAAADDYSRTRLSDSDVDIAAGTQLSMQLDEPLTLPAHAVRAAVRNEARRTRQSLSADVAGIQRALKRRDLYSGPIDGELGDSTRLGIIRLQIESQLPPTGDLDARTLAALGLLSAAVGRTP